MPDIQQVIQLADELKPWGEVVAPLFMFGFLQARALARRLQRRYEPDAPETQAQAILNGSDAARRIREEVEGRVARGELTAGEAAEAFARPDIAKHAQDALLAASETPDALMHEELAKLIGARLVAAQDSQLSIILRMSCDQLRYLNSRQLRILGLSFAVLKMQVVGLTLDYPDRASLKAAYEAYLADLADTLAPFRDLEPPASVEFMHFEELGLAKLSSWTAQLKRHTSGDVSVSTLLQPLQMQFIAMLQLEHDASYTPDPTVAWINSLMWGDYDKDHFGLKAAKLTPVGSAIGFCMYCIAHGLPFLPQELGIDYEIKKPSAPGFGV